MKKILFFFLTISFIGCGSSLKKTQNAINSGDYNNAISLAVKKLRKNKTNKKSQHYIKALEEAFSKAVVKDQQQLAYLQKENNPENIERIFNLYTSLHKRQELIKPLLPLTFYKTTKEATFNFEDYQDEIINAKNRFVEQLYSGAKSLLSSANKMDVRQAYKDFKYADQLKPNYKDTRSLLREAHAKGTDYVFVSINNKTEQVIPKRLEDDLLNFQTYGLDDFWTVYQSNKNPNLDYDYRLELNFRRIDISPERVRERQLVEEKDIKDGFRYLKNEQGQFVKDSLGNKIKIDKFKKVRCELYEFTQFKSCNVVGKVNYIDEKTNQMLETFPIESNFVFEHAYANYDGDRRALNDFFLDLIGLREVRFPSNEQMIYDTGKDLKQKLKRIITRNKFR